MRFTNGSSFSDKFGGLKTKIQDMTHFQKTKKPSKASIRLLRAQKHP